MIREAEEGNVQAGRLVLEHFGKLDNRVKVQVVSPFEKFLKYDLTEEIEDAEFIENDEVIDDLKLISSQYHDIVGKDIDLPNRNPVNNNPGVRKHDEQRRNALSTQYEKKKLEKVQIQKNMYQRRKRAKEVGLELLPRGRQTQSVRNKWWDELERLELIKFGEIRGERF
jgi:hypothetical protein